MFGRGEEAELSASSPVSVPGCRVEGVAPQVIQFLGWESSSVIECVLTILCRYKFLYLFYF